MASGVAVGGLGRGSALAETLVVTRDAAHAAARVAAVFDLVAALPSMPAVMIPMATKGDLPLPHGCVQVQIRERAACTQVAYEGPAEPSIVVETSEGTTTTLMRVDPLTLADITDELQLQSK